MSRDGWDAESYEYVSSVQLKWGLKLLSSRSWSENEIVLDAGAGPGLLTKTLAEKVPRGRVYAVDQDSAMIAQAKQNLGRFVNVSVLQSDMSTVQLPEKVNVVFSNAAVHWVLDHRRLFAHFRTLLKENGELLIQCGGMGNLQSTLAIINELKSDPDKGFARHFSDWKPTWFFGSDEQTEQLLKSLGYRDIVARLSTDLVKFESRDSFSKFARTVILRPYLQYLTDPEIRDEFVTEFEDSVAAHGDWILDYVRLTITAKK